MVKAVKPKLSIKDRLAASKAGKQQQLFLLTLFPHLCWALFRGQHAAAEDWHAVQFRLKVGLLLAKLFEEGPDILCLESLSKLQIVDSRFYETGVWSCTSEESAVVGEALNLIDEMYAVVSTAQQYAAMVSVANEMNVLQEALQSQSHPRRK